MKNALTVVLFRLFTIGVCVDLKEESVSVTEGDSVTLKSGVTEIQTDDEIEWRFSGSKIASISRDDSGISVWVKPDGSFRDRLQLDNQTGDLKISNIRTGDSGLYKVKISSPRGSSEIIFTVKGVCVDLKEESVSVTEGDSVTLKSGVTEIQTDDEIEWRFSGTRIATISRDDSGISVWVKPDGSFKDTLQLDHQTGDLKISNIRTGDSGLYKVKISSPRGSSEIIFTVKVVSADVSAAAVKSVSVLKGDSVTLHTDLTDIQRDAVIQWRYDKQKSPVAEINRKAGIFNTYDGPDERFRDRLQLDCFTGSLIITNTKTEDTGLYEAEISSSISRHTIHHTQSFSVTVRDAVKSVSVKKGETVTLQITEIQKDDLILWMFGEIVLAEIFKADQRFFTYDGPDERFGGRLKLDHQTGSLIITNTRTTDSGLYEVKISSSRHTINRRITVTVRG